MYSIFHDVISLTQPCITLGTILKYIVLGKTYWSICPFLSDPIHRELLTHGSGLLATLFVIDNPWQL